MILPASKHTTEEIPTSKWNTLIMCKFSRTGILTPRKQLNLAHHQIFTKYRFEPMVPSQNRPDPSQTPSAFGGKPFGESDPMRRSPQKNYTSMLMNTLWIYMILSCWSSSLHDRHDQPAYPYAGAKRYGWSLRCHALPRYHDALMLHHDLQGTNSSGLLWNRDARQGAATEHSS